MAEPKQKETTLGVWSTSKPLPNKPMDESQRPQYESSTVSPQRSVVYCGRASLVDIPRRRPSTTLGNQSTDFTSSLLKVNLAPEYLQDSVLIQTGMGRKKELPDLNERNIGLHSSPLPLATTPREEIRSPSLRGSQVSVSSTSILQDSNTNPSPQPPYQSTHLQNSDPTAFTPQAQAQLSRTPTHSPPWYETIRSFISSITFFQVWIMTTLITISVITITVVLSSIKVLEGLETMPFSGNGTAPMEANESCGQRQNLGDIWLWVFGWVLALWCVS